MYTLLLRLAGPMQSWGADSKFEVVRRTQKEPTKSGVIGLIASAMGRSRTDSVDDLAELRFGVRVDQPGKVICDLQTVRPPTAKSENDNYKTHRHYLADAAFLVGLECRERALLDEICGKLLHPARPLFLGRRSCPPTLPLLVGVREESLEAALIHEPWQASPYMQGKLDRNLRLFVESYKKTDTCMVQQDVPVSYDSRCRQYRCRYVRDAGRVPARIKA